MRPIDAEALSEGIELHRKGTDQEGESDRQWAVGYNAGLDRALYIIAYAKTIAPPPNDPLTLDELRAMIGSMVQCGSVDGQFFGRMLVGMNGCVICDSFDFSDYGKTWLAYRRKPEERTV